MSAGENGAPMLARTFTIRALSIICSALCFVLIAAGQSRAIDTHDSKLIVHVSKEGLFSAFGDNHEVEAPITEGLIDEGARRVCS
jgi:hypothetical protein